MKREGYAFTSANGRRWDWQRDRQVTCPDGHHFPDTMTVDESGYIRCNKVVGDSRDRGTGNRPTCGKMFFLLWIRGGGNVVVEVTEAEREQLHGMASTAQRIDFLGIWTRASTPIVPLHGLADEFLTR
jgi:hypothetical protein